MFHLARGATQTSLYPQALGMLADPDAAPSTLLLWITMTSQAWATAGNMCLSLCVVSLAWS